MKTSSRNIIIVVILLCVSGCTKYIQKGIFSTTEPNYKIVLNDDSTYLYDYMFHIGEYVSSGFWRQKNDHIFLTSNIQDVMNYPVTQSTLNGNSNPSFIVFKGINLLFYDWFCIVDTDTIHLVNDTLYTAYRIPFQVFLCARPINRPTLYNRRNMGGNPAIFAAPRTRLVKSEPIEITQNANHEIIVDSVFGESPLYYLPFKEEMFKLSRGGIRDVQMGFFLSTRQDTVTLPNE